MYVFTAALIVKAFDSQPFDQPHVHVEPSSQFLDYSVPISTTASPSAMVTFSSYTQRE